MAFVPFTKEDQPTMAAFNEKFSAVLAEAIEKAGLKADELFAAGTKIATGSYTGTGKYGSANKNTLNFNFTPKIVFVFTENMGFVFGDDESMTNTRTLLALRPATQAQGVYGGTGNVDYYQHFTWGDNSFSWYGSASNAASASAHTQLNASGTTYYYIAIG